MSKFLSKKLSSLEAYVPGEQPRDKRYIKLNTNESPYPPPTEVVSAVGKAEIEDLRLYSDPECTALKSAIAEQYEVKTKNVFISNGSDEVLNFAFMAYGDKGVVFPDITYGFYSVFADLYNIDTEVIPLNDDFTVDINAFCGKNSLVVLANPNAPTGIALGLSEIEKIVSSNPDGVVIIDEAYVDFGAESAVKLTEKYSNLLVVQTFSKSRSMAGARLGFAFANEQIIEDLEKIKYSTNPYNINRLTQIAGAAALKNQAYFDRNSKKIAETREYVKNELIGLEFTVTDSKANFLFAKSDKISGKELYLSLKERGVLIRHFESKRIKDFNRITIGSRVEMEIFLKEVREIIGGKL
ncbi:MAG: histidinol-phosphate transaminase [Acutalibacteraceae bacterium]|nr:histidinol-phosphate transaminase [Acutalibacteraceae bacterium]